MMLMQTYIAAAVALTLTASAWAEHVAIFVFDQTLDAVIRIEDTNEDGDTLDDGEVTIFMDDTPPVALGLDNSQGMLALGPHELLATDNFAPDNILRMRDLNGDGDAFDSDETFVYFDGALPNGFNLVNPVCISRGPDDALYIIDNNTLDAANPEAVYKLLDLNDDGDVNDPGEVTLYFQLSPAGASQTTTFDIEFDAAGNGYVIDITDPNQIESVDRIDPAAMTITEFIDSADLFAMTGLLISGTFEMTYDGERDAILAVVATLSLSARIIALRDINGSGTIDSANEIRVLWSDGANADGHESGTPRDIFLAPDGSLVFVDALNDQIVRLVDRNGDGDYNDFNETRVVYDSAAAAAVGQPALVLPLSIAAAVVLPTCSADIGSATTAGSDGKVDVFDLLSMLNAWGDCDNVAPCPQVLCFSDIAGPEDSPDCAVDVFDLLELFNQWGHCLP